MTEGFYDYQRQLTYRVGTRLRPHHHEPAAP